MRKVMRKLPCEQGYEQELTNAMRGYEQGLSKRMPTSTSSLGLPAQPREFGADVVDRTSPWIRKCNGMEKK